MYLAHPLFLVSFYGSIIDQYALREHSELCGPLRSMGQMVETQECALATDIGRHRLLPAQLVPDHQNWRDLWEVLEGKEGGPL